MGFHLQIKNYRVIRSVDLEADGVCVLVGPNGSGKSTLLSAIEFLRNAFDRGFNAALNFSGGPWGFTNISSPKDMPTTFAIKISDLQWEITPTVTSNGAVYPIPEELKYHNRVISYLSEDITDNNVEDKFSPSQSLLLRRKYDSHSGDGVFENIKVPFVRVLRQYQHYSNYHLWTLRKSGSLAGNEISLQYGGQNAFSVLRNWHSSKPLRERYDFVIETLKEAFPAFFGDLDFESAGQTVSIRIYPPDSDIPVPVYFISNGFLTALLHLMAVCSAPDGGIIGIDEPENGLHPYAIKVIIEAFRDRAEDRNLTVLLATHSTFILNAFNEEPDKVFIMDHDEEEEFVRLDKIRDPEWLKYFALGDLYGKDFAIQEKR